MSEHSRHPAVTDLAPGITVWLTGLPAAGKTTTSQSLSRHYSQRGVRTYVLDGDVLRRGVNANLGFSKEDRSESVRRAGEVALLLAAMGEVVIACLVSPYATARAAVRERHRQAGVPFFEVFVSAPLEVCESRDPKGLYVRARRGELEMVTGVNDPYEVPAEADFTIPTDLWSPAEAAQRLADAVDRCLETEAARRLGGG